MSLNKIKKLIRIANEFDLNGEFKKADFIDRKILKLSGEDDKFTSLFGESNDRLPNMPDKSDFEIPNLLRDSDDEFDYGDFSESDFESEDFNSSETTEVSEDEVENYSGPNIAYYESDGDYSYKPDMSDLSEDIFKSEDDFESKDDFESEDDFYNQGPIMSEDDI